MIFVDTNIFLRFLLRDNEKQYLEAKELFLRAARGEVELTTSLLVFFEIVWVLKSVYGKNKKELIKILRSLLHLNFLIKEKQLLLESLIIFQKENLSLEDCFNLKFAEERQVKEFKTFDIKLKKEFEKIVGRKKS